MITWNVTAQFLRHINIAKVEIPLHRFLNGFKILESRIENDTLILQFAHKEHYLHQDVAQHVVSKTNKIASEVKPRHHEIE
jgi:hypothetical protein